MEKTLGKIYVIGHRNPDPDSIGAATALAALRRRTAPEDCEIVAACAGIPGARAEYIFKRFNVPLPVTVNDIYPRVRDIMDKRPQSTPAGGPLLNAITQLSGTRSSHLPVLNADGTYRGMLGLFGLLDELLMLSGDGKDLTGRKVRSSLSLIVEVLKAESLSLHDPDKVQDFAMYVAAMNIESFKDHIPREHPEELCIVVGDRPDIHLMAINLGARVMIVTGSRQVDQVVIDAAAARGVSIIKTPYDSATVIRRLKFTSPVEMQADPQGAVFHPGDVLAEVQRQLRAQPEGIFPVVNNQNRLIGTFRKSDLERAPLSVILVDHNEFENAVSGVDKVPVVEIVDHHRFGMPPTALPLKITCDAVGSTCTLVTEMYLQEQAEITPPLAGVLMGGILTDTMMLRSPTTTPRDITALKYLETRAGVSGEKLSAEIFAVGSPIMKETPEVVLTADKKEFTSGEFHLAIAQVEEVSFEPFYARETELLAAAEKMRELGGLDFFGLLVTNVVKATSILLVSARPAVAQALPFVKLHNHLYDLPNVVSRKKQLVPQLLKILETL